MLTKILIDKKNTLSWDTEERLLNLCNGFEVDNKNIILWVADDDERVTRVLREENISYQVLKVSDINY